MDHQYLWEIIAKYLDLADVKNMIILSKDFNKLQFIMFDQSYIDANKHEAISTDKYGLVKNIFNVGDFGLLNKFPNVVRVTCRSMPGNINVFDHPMKIKYLTFECGIDRSVWDCVPPSVTHLDLGYYFNQDIKENVLENVTNLTLGQAFTHSLGGRIPKSLTHLTISEKTFDDNKKYIHENIHVTTFENNILEIKISRAKILKNLINSIPMDNITMQCDSENQTIRINELSLDKCVLIDATLKSNNFEYFNSKTPTTSLSMNTIQLKNLLEFIDTNDAIILYINDTRRHLYIHSARQNNNIITKIGLFDRNQPILPIPQTMFTCKATMNSDELYLHFSRLKKTKCDFVEIECNGEEINFIGRKQDVEIIKSYKHITNTKIKNTYEVNSLWSFRKLSKLCKNVDLYLKNDFPLVLNIQIEGLLKYNIFITPVNI